MFTFLPPFRDLFPLLVVLLLREQSLFIGLLQIDEFLPDSCGLGLHAAFDSRLTTDQTRCKEYRSADKTFFYWVGSTRASRRPREARSRHIAHAEHRKPSHQSAASDDTLSASNDLFFQITTMHCDWALYLIDTSLEKRASMELTAMKYLPCHLPGEGPA